MSRKFSFLITFTAGVAAIAAVCLFLEGFRPKHAEKADSEVVRPVRTMELSRKNGAVRSYFGSVQGSQRANLSFRVSGPLLELPAEKGMAAKKGDLLARLDPRDFKTKLAQAQSLLAQAKAQYQDAASNFKRYEELYKQKVIAAAQYDAYKAQLDVTRSAVAQAEAQVKAAQDALNDTELRAPFDGIVADRMVENYQDVQPKQTVINFQNVDTLELVFHVPERDIFLVPISGGEDPVSAIDFASGFRFSARFDAIPGRAFPLTLKEFAAQADTNTQTYPVTVTMAQPEGARVLPGMAVTVDVDFSATEDDFFTVPPSALLDEGDTSFVWRCEASDTDHAAVRVPVTVGGLRGDLTEIRSEELAAGDVIITAGVHFLKDGQKVRLVKAGDRQ